MSDKHLGQYVFLPLAPDNPPQPKRRSLVARFRAWLRWSNPVRIWLDESAYIETQIRTGGLYGWLLCIINWWHYRPMIVECACCGWQFWWNGKPREYVFCSEGCAYYGPKDDYQADDDIPF